MGTEKEEEEYCRDLTKPRKVHFKTGWKHFQNAVYWIHLGRTKSHGIIPPAALGERVSADHNILKIDEESRNEHRNALIVLHSYPTRSQDAQEAASCLRRFLLAVKMPGRILTDNPKEVIKTLQDPPKGSRKELFDESNKEQQQRQFKVAHPMKCGTAQRNVWEMGDPRNRNSAVNRRSVYVDRETTGFGV